LVRETGMTNGRTGNARNDLLTGGIVLAAIVMFVWNGEQLVSSTIQMLYGGASGADRTLVVAMLLNIALILFGWCRYNDLSKEVVERASAEQRAQSLAVRDPLTGFYNRRAFNDQGTELMTLAFRRQKAVALLMLDLDHFKNVNDVHGHAVGDVLLKAIAARIATMLPPSALSGRLGGDEFACILAFDHDYPDVVERIAQAIVSDLAQPIDANGVNIPVSVSCGIARSDSDCRSVDSLMRRANLAMYAAKHQGRNRHSWFDASMERELQARNELEYTMRNDITAGSFVPFFEQQIDLTTGRLRGFEMLARWEHPKRGLVSPEVFIPIAEETGMIADLSLAVMRTALIEARNWDSSLTLSVNISPFQLKDPWLAQKIVMLLTETGFPASRLVVEITETSLFENLSLAQSIVGSLKNQGVKLALDDFGTGYSSLAHLRALPFDRIKIDKSFVTSIIDNAESAAIVNAILRLSESLNLPVTAEGIENAAIEERLQQMGCQKGQGWHYGRPTSIMQTRTLLAERNLLPNARLTRAALAHITPDEPVSSDVTPVSEPLRRSA
jgi:diguanylate cyclase (GGDEF)-like protein